MTQIFCPSCKKQLSVNAKFCGYCGASTDQKFANYQKKSNETLPKSGNWKWNHFILYSISFLIVVFLIYLIFFEDSQIKNRTNESYNQPGYLKSSNDYSSREELKSNLNNIDTTLKIDNVTPSSDQADSNFSSEEIFYDGFDTNFDNWILFGDPLPIWISNIFNKNGLFDNNGDGNNNSGAITKNEWDFSNGSVIESEVFLDFSDLTGCWNSVSIGIADPVYTNWGGYDASLFFGYTANGDACWASPAGTKRHAILTGGYLSSNGWVGFGDLNSNPIYVDSSINKWQTLKIVMRSDRIPKFYFGHQLIYTGKYTMADQLFSQNNRIWLGDRSSGIAGKAYHNYVRLSKIVEK
jgi:hypothetical protein